MSVHVTPEHLERAERFVKEIKGDDGLAVVDIEKFRADDKIAHEKIWDDDCPQMPFDLYVNNLCVYDELGETPDWYRLEHDHDYRIGLAKRYNDIAEPIIHSRPLGESKPDPERQWKGIKGLHDIFEGKNVWHNESYWLMQAADNPAELSALLDRVDKRLENLREFMLPEDWAEQKERLTGLGCNIPRYRAQRGPITFAMSLYGVENLIYLIMDDEPLAKRFSETILRAMLERGKVLDEEAGFTPETMPKGFYWLDDNCAMLNADMYELFGYPIIKGVFDYYCPNPEDRRGQHSDSDMGHLMPLLNELGMQSVNLGPNLSVTEIREAIPKAVICGQLAPFTYSRNEEVNMVAELLRDFEMSKDKKGVNFTTAGSVNDGSRLSGLRLMMSAVQHLCQY